MNGDDDSRLCWVGRLGGLGRSLVALGGTRRFAGFFGGCWADAGGCWTMLDDAGLVFGDACAILVFARIW